MSCTKIKCVKVSLYTPSADLKKLRKYVNQLKECEICVSECEWIIDCMVKKRTLTKLRHVLEMSKKEFLYWKK